MPNPERYAFTLTDDNLGEASLRPYLPISLTYSGKTVRVSGLLDTGSSINVLPYRLGLELGANWDDCVVTLDLTGNLAQYEARVLVLNGVVGSFDPVKLAFAWTRAETVPVIFGQVNFFMEFNVCFYRSEEYLEVAPKR